MKKLILLLSFVALYNIAYPQYFLGMTLRELASQIHKVFGIEEIQMDFKNNIATWRGVKAETNYEAYFDKSNKTYKVLWIPDNEKVLKDYIKMFNEQFTQMSDKEWTIYTNSTFYSVKIDYTLTGTPIIFTKL